MEPSDSIAVGTAAREHSEDLEGICVYIPRETDPPVADAKSPFRGIDTDEAFDVTMRRISG
jgi:hypothetical protein